MAKLFSKDQLPHFQSTRDTRDRLDLITENVPVGAAQLRADRIIYHPGDSCAKHYHIGSSQLFVVLAGEGQGFDGQISYEMKPGTVVAVPPGELHWFENNSEADFKFVEFWAPLAEETVWVVDDDI